ncbi:hypothetical protein GIB67_006427 [Kingdonia uniflora]|uniref:CCT domain-containing protein n=1 Tax=Kingdonia uniflora TaxID=39325 RepID=A0A7J7P0V3_9MAGN|nr:hypothetical protein GIB67_006427 [Kingdonia uniflora]
MEQQFKTMAKRFDVIDERCEKLDRFIYTFITGALYAPSSQPIPLGPTVIPSGNLFPTSTISEYDLGGEGDLFKAPEPIIEKPMISLDPMSAAISMISCGNDVISPQTGKVVDIESGHLLSEVFYECKKDLLENTAMRDPFSEVLEFKIPVLQIEEPPAVGSDKLVSGRSIQKSASSGCLNSVELKPGNSMRPNFLDFQGIDFGAAYGMRRAFSEGDIQTLGNVDRSLNHPPLNIINHVTEDRMQKLSRYRKKKSKRNFGRTIKYACRKALADNQPRVRGRFAKTEESEVVMKQ